MPRVTQGSDALPVWGTGAMAVLLRREARGPAIAVELVTERDLGEAQAELWLEAFLRQGRVDVPLEDVRAVPRPIYHAPSPEEPIGSSEGSAGGDGEICLGFRLEAREGTGERIACLFPRTCLEPVAARAAQRLIDAGQLVAGDTYHWELAGAPPELVSRARKRTPTGVLLRPSAREAFPVLRTPLAPLLQASEPVLASESRDGDLPVFFTRQARERAEEVARRGAACTPPVETGGLLVGPLCSCPETGELFAVVLDVLEATESEATTYSLTYSGSTWAHIQEHMRARRARPDSRSHRLLGQVHGHSFLPMESSLACSECAAFDVCERTTAFLSADDLAWCRAVFSREPWQLSQIFGLDARGEGVEGFFGQRGGKLAARGYRLIEAFEPGPHTTTND